MTKKYHYPHVVMEDSRMTLNGGNELEAVLFIDYEQVIPIIQRIYFGLESIRFKSADIIFEITEEKKEAVLIIET